VVHNLMYEEARQFSACFAPFAWSSAIQTPHPLIF